MRQESHFSHRQYQLMALAGLLQCSQQVTMLARQGLWNEAAARPCIHSLFQMDANSVVDIYGSIQSLKPGLRHLIDLLQRKIDRADVETTRYAVSLLHHERKLKQQAAMLNGISQRLYAIRNEYDISDIDSNDFISRIADAYGETISNIQPKIQVEGSKKYLLQEVTVNRIRTMLFSGIRSAVLWRQLGGSRWKLLFQRRRILSDARYLLEM
jgi:high frequency lysogenization protein